MKDRKMGISVKEQRRVVLYLFHLSLLLLFVRGWNLCVGQVERRRGCFFGNQEGGDVDVSFVVFVYNSQ